MRASGFRILMISVLVFEATPAFCDDQTSLSVGKVRFNGQNVIQPFSLTNKTPSVIERAWIQCGFYSGSILLSAKDFVVNHIGVNDTAFGEIIAILPDGAHSDATKCRWYVER